MDFVSMFYLCCVIIVLLAFLNWFFDKTIDFIKCRIEKKEERNSSSMKKGGKI